MTVAFKLRFDLSTVESVASGYSYPGEDLITQQIGPSVQQRAYYTRDEFLTVARWKSPRNVKRYAQNDEEFIRAVTQTALAARSERLRIEVLTLLDGVNWPTASVLLHFGRKDEYPILDFRALWSLNVDVPPDTYKFYNFDLWWAYTEFCRQLAKEASVSMRTLDRALWQFSKDHQKDVPVPANDIA
jgi:hypothetical protein